ncbi:TIGR02391 family protein [Chloroflexota bacterium]
MTDTLAVQEYEQAWQQKLAEAEKRIHQLEQENAELQAEIEEDQSPWADISDNELRERLIRLGNPPLDTIIREAGVIFEHRLRSVSGLDTSKVGTKLVDAAFEPKAGALQYSSHGGEQQGVMMLYRGAMQFIRNPPMHKLIEYPETTARLLVRLIDSLLILLSEGVSKEKDDDVTLDDVRLMLTRRYIRPGQLALYKALYKAGDEGLSSPELAEAVGRTRQQLAGSLGALGRRIQNTPGLDNGRGIGIVFEITLDKNGDYHYQMRPILRQALEIENIV